MVLPSKRFMDRIPSVGGGWARNARLLGTSTSTLAAHDFGTILEVCYGSRSQLRQQGALHRTERTCCDEAAAERGRLGATVIAVHVAVAVEADEPGDVHGLMRSLQPVDRIQQASV
jgi:hypothetical protein